MFKMLLQPLVENAFIHGLESRPSDGTLYLGAKVEGNSLPITVRDNGGGITPKFRMARFFASGQSGCRTAAPLHTRRR